MSAISPTNQGNTLENLFQDVWESSKTLVVDFIYPAAQTLFFSACYASIVISITAIAMEVFFQIASSLVLLGLLTISGYGLLYIQAQIEGTSVDDLAIRIGAGVIDGFTFLYDRITSSEA